MTDQQAPPSPKSQAGAKGTSSAEPTENPKLAKVKKTLEKRPSTRTKPDTINNEDSSKIKTEEGKDSDNAKRRPSSKTIRREASLTKKSSQEVLNAKKISSASLIPPTAGPTPPIAVSEITPIAETSQSDTNPSTPTAADVERQQTSPRLPGGQTNTQESNFEEMDETALQQLLETLEKSIEHLTSEQKRLQLLFKQEDHQTEQLKSLFSSTSPIAASTSSAGGPASPLARTNTKTKQKSDVRLVDTTSLKLTFTSPLTTKTNRTEREDCMVELLTSELLYVTFLRILAAAYVQPLCELAKAQNKFTEESINSICGSILLVYQTSDDDKCLHKLLEDRFSHWDEANDCIGDILEKWCTPTTVGPYHTFCANFNENTRQLTHLLNTNNYFKRSFSEIEDHVQEQQGMQFTGLHVCPMSRLQRYSLLLKHLLKITPESHPDFKPLTAAVNFLEENVSQLAAKRAAEDSQVFSRFERLAKEPAETFGPSEIQQETTRATKANMDTIRKKPKDVRKIRKRVFLKSITLTNIVDLSDAKPRVSKKKDVELLLFNDILVAAPFYGKKNPCHEYYQPTSCLWIDWNPMPTWFSRVDHNEDLVKNVSMVIVVKGPLTCWALQFKSVSDKKTWQTEISKVTGVSVTAPFKGFRNGVFDFPGKGRYDGNWFTGLPHGEGFLETNASEFFEGHWHCTLKCGYGQYIDSRGHTYSCGWKDHGDRVEAHAWFWENLTSENLLDTEDWRMIMEKAEIVKVKKDSVVVEKGKVQNKLMRCTRGSLRIELRKGVITTIPSPYTLGDSSFVSEIKVANRSVWAHEDCEFEEVPTQLLLSLFQTKPRLGMRFYRDKARKLAVQLRMFNPDLIDDDEGEEESKADQEGDRTSAARFKLPETEVLKETISKALLKEKIEYEGTLYILTTVVAFEYSVFGIESQKVIHLGNTKSIKFNNKKEQIKIDKLKFVVKKDGKRVYEMINGIWEESRKKKKMGQSSRQLPARVMTDFTLTENDIELMLAGAREKRYHKGDVIVKEGDFSHKLYQVNEGSVVVSKHSGFSTVLGSGVLFGEISFLESGDNAKATASVIADSDVKVYLLEGWYINALFVDHPTMAPKFYSYLCSTLAKRLLQREQLAKQEKMAKRAQDKK